MTDPTARSGLRRLAVRAARLILWVAIALAVAHGPSGSGWAADAPALEAPPVVVLSGAPYEMGLQHGRLLREEVRALVRRVLGYFREYLKIPVLRVVAADWWLGRAWRRARPFVPPAYLEELRGLADGSGVAFRDLCLLHAVPDRTYSCSSLAAWGPATATGRLIHTRNLDWNIDVGIQEFATVFVVRPAGRRAFVNVGWAGFIGVLTGVNDAQISLGQIGAETTDTAARGLPMAFLMRRVLEEAEDLDTAVRLIEQATRTVGVNYVIADAKARRAVAVETTHRHAQRFEANDPKEHGVAYARPIPHAVFRADTAMDPTIRDIQLASRGRPHQPGLEDPAGSSAYDVRYLGQADGLTRHHGRLDATRALETVRAVAPSSNVQSVVFAWPTLWVANAQGTVPAAETRYHAFNLEELLRVDVPSAKGRP